MRLLLTPEAASNLAEIGDYLRQHNPSAALRVRDTILGSLELLVDYPEIGRLQTTAGVRKLVTLKFGYLASDVVDRDQQAIVVLAIAPPAQKREHDDR